MGIDRAKFRKPVLPGDLLHYHVKKIRSRGRAWRFYGEAKVNGQVVAEAEISAMILDQDEANSLTCTHGYHRGWRAARRRRARSGRSAWSAVTSCWATGVKLISHVVGDRPHDDRRAHAHVSVRLARPSEPQDLKYKGEHATLAIGAHCTIREGVTMNPGTAGGGSVTTVVGDSCTFLVN